MSCECGNKTNCIICFKKYAESVKDYIDNKDLACEAESILYLSAIEDEFYIPDEFYKLTNSW